MKFWTALLFFGLVTACSAGEITIQGKGEAKALPDQAVIIFTIGTQAIKIDDAMKACNQETVRAYETLEKKFSLVKQMKTGQLSVQPVFKDKKITGFTATNRIAITLSNVSQVSEVVKFLNGHRIDSVFFIASDDLKNKLVIEARKNAMVEATDKAKLYANAAKMKMGAVKSVVEHQEDLPYRDLKDAKEPINIGEFKVMIAIQAVFLLGQVEKN